MFIGIHAETVCESLLLTFVLNFLLCSCFKCACVSKKDNDYINHIIAQELRKTAINLKTFVSLPLLYVFIGMESWKVIVVMDTSFYDRLYIC